MQRKLVISWLMLMAVSLAAQLPVQSEKWQVEDIPFRLNKQVESPLEISFGAIFEHPSGRQMRIPGFYDGASTWILRFCPPEQGPWSYTTWSTLPELAGRKGRVDAGPPIRKNSHGPVVISGDDSTKFAYADGSPYFLMAYEMDWLFALDAENPDDIPRTKQIISHLVENQFNQVIMNVYAYDALWGDREHVAPEHNFAEPRVFPFGGSNKEPDFSTLNLEFFQRFDRVMKHLDQEGIISHLMIYVWNKKVNWPAAGSPDDNRYFDYVIKRYQAFPNLIWDISKEALGYGHNDMGYITERIERLRTLDGHKRLLSVHDYAYCKAFPGKVDFISIQNWDPNIYSVTREVVRRHPGKPVFNIEHGGYEKTMHSIFDGSYHDALACLDRNYQILFAGAYSTYYWQNSSWYEIVYDPAALPAEKQPKFSWYKHLVQLFRDYDYTRLRHHPGASNCLSDGKGNYLMYLPRGMISMQGDLKELKGKKARIRWFDPLRGIYVEGGSRDFSQGTWLGIPRSPVISSPICVGILEVED